MKKRTIVLLASLLLGSSVMAMSSKVQKPESVEGTSLGKYKKPGAPVDIKYVTQHIQPGDESKIDIRLITSQKSGVMKVKLKLDKTLTPLGTFSPEKRFSLNGKSEYPISFKVVANSDGVYYIRLLIEMEEKGFRAFAVPVYVGNGTLNLKRKPVTKTKSGEKISISPAKESIINR